MRGAPGQAPSPAHQHMVERVMDSNDLEKERGITILCQELFRAVRGHAYQYRRYPRPRPIFAARSSALLSMVDSVLLLVDAVEGPMPQTRFVTRKALRWGSNP